MLRSTRARRWMAWPSSTMTGCSGPSSAANARNASALPPAPAIIHTGDRVRISVDGGVQPTWHANQRELFFLAPDGAMMSAPITVAASAMSAGQPRRLFSTPLRPGYQGEQYAPLPGGRGFLIRVPAEGSDTLRFVVNWPERVRPAQ